MYKDWLKCTYGANVALSCEGGSRSLSVFDNDVGSGSISPLIVTGGKGGDIGIHDFRYIATGKAKRHRYFDTGEQNSRTSLNSDKDKNVNGMLWYIPKAHSGKDVFLYGLFFNQIILLTSPSTGSITKIATIPNTSLFFTGSKDGDVKLWDVKSTKLVCEWPKLHEKHTFIQPSSRGFGGVVRVICCTHIDVLYHVFTLNFDFNEEKMSSYDIFEVKLHGFYTLRE